VQARKSQLLDRLGRRGWHSTVTFSLRCEGPPSFSGVGEIVYGQDRYTGSMKMDVGGQAMTVTYSAKAYRRLHQVTVPWPGKGKSSQIDAKNVPMSDLISPRSSRPAEQ
jgi:hypothetical protein